MSGHCQKHFEEFGRVFLRYEPNTGQFFYLNPEAKFFHSSADWKSWTANNAGKRAGGSNSDGYIQLVIRGRSVPAHRYAWYCVHGCWPDLIDHLNGDPADNRIENLRDVDHSTNRMNQRRRSDNQSGVTGVFFDARKSRWIAHICERGNRRQLGSYKEKSEAVAVRLLAQKRLGFGPMHGASK